MEKPSDGPEFKVPENELKMEQMIRDLGADRAPRVSAEGIAAKIFDVLYSEFGNGLTVCVITLKNGFSFVDMSAPASPENFNKEIGRKIAYERAFKQIWSHEGYLLKEVLYHQRLQHAAQGQLQQAQKAHAEGKSDPDPTDSQAAMGNPAHE